MLAEVFAPRSLRAAAVALTCAATLLGCNDHPLVKIESILTATQDDRFVLPPKTKLDILFVVDNSGSMCEEQVNLGENFRAFASFLYEDLGDNADYRLAVTSTDLRTQGQGGNFLNTPAAPNQLINCTRPDGTPFVPDTADCPANLPLVLKSSDIANQEQLVRNFRCMATLGTQGDSFEKGLEAMRLSLSCNGPNRAQFGQCCIPRDGLTPAQAESVADGFVYDPFCEIEDEAQEPEFLRPDALLVVVFVTDENDCSDPFSNPPESNLAICKYGTGDGDGNGIPDGYRDQEICSGLNETECFQRECSTLTAEDCQERRCVVDRLRNSNCEWYRDRLVPVSDYQDFLNGLKLSPERQVIVASIVGSRAYTESGEEIFFNLPETPTNPACDPDNPAFGSISEDACCPGGQCEGRIQPSCQSDNGIAFAGRRYLQLAEAYGPNGIGCPAGSDEFGECVTICVDDFAEPLEALRDTVAVAVSQFCLDKRPSCLVPTADGEGTEPCDSEAEFADARNYAIRVRLESCVQPGLPRDQCPEFSNTVIPTAGYNIGPDNSCPGGYLLSLTELPPANSRVQLEYLVGTGEAPSAVEGGAGGEVGAGGEIGAGGAGGAGGQAVVDDGGLGQ